MKKIVYLEMLLLSALLVASVLISAKMDQPAFSPDNITASNSATNSSQNTQGTEAAPTDPTWNTYPEDRQLTAQQYFVYDCTARTYLLNSGTEDDRIYPASITKLFTAYVAMYYLHPDTYCEVGDAIDLVAPGSSLAQLQKGDRLTARQLLESMLITSGNDAAYMIACETGRILTGQSTLDAASAVKAFVEEMNTRAQALGMPNTHFTNPDGIHDPDHYTTVKDLTTLATLCMTDKTIMRTSVTPSADMLLNGRIMEWKNTNELINPESAYYCPHAMGLKTGQTPESGSCLLSIFRKDGQYLVIGVFGSTSHTDRFDDTLQLFNEIALK